MFKKFFWVVAILLLFIITSALAQNTEPGDFLYGFKTQVNDRFGWSNVEYTQIVDEQIDDIETQLATIESKVKSGKITPAEAVVLRDKLVTQIDTATAAITTSNSVSLSSAQVIQLKAGLDRMQRALSRYSATLKSLDDIAEKDTTKKKSSRRASDAVADVVTVIEEEIIDAVEEMGGDVANEISDIIDEITATSTADVVTDEESDVDVNTDNTSQTDQSTTTEDTSETSEINSETETTHEMATESETSTDPDTAEDTTEINN